MAREMKSQMSGLYIIRRTSHYECLMVMNNLGLRQEHSKCLSWHIILMRPVNLASEVKAICFVGAILELILNCLAIQI